MEITTSLQALGLTQSEALMYAALLEMGQGSVLEIARTAGVKRPTAYRILDSLKERGLVRSTLFRGVKDYRLNSIQHLKSFVVKQQKIVETHTPALRLQYEQRARKLRTRSYVGVSGIKTLLEKVLREDCSLWAMGPEEKFQTLLEQYWDFFKKRIYQHGEKILFKSAPSSVVLLLWSDKTAFVVLGDIIESFAIKHKGIHDFYKNVWKTNLKNSG